MRPVEGTILTVARGAAEEARAAADAGQVAGRRGRGGPGGGGRGPGPHAVAPARAGAGRGGRRRGDRATAALRRPAHRGRRTAHAPAPRAARAPWSAPLNPGAAGRPRPPAPSPMPTPSWPACATRSCTCSRHPTRPSRRSRRCGPASATRSWWSAATACGTATSTPTTSAPPSRPASMPDGRGPSGSPTCSSRWRRSGGCARRRRRPGRARPSIPPGPAPVTGVVAVATGDGIGRIFRSLGVQGLIAGGQSMNPSTADLVEAVDALALGRGHHPAQQRQHPAGGRAGRRPDREVGLGRAHRDHRRGFRRPAGLRPRGRR